MRVNHPIVVAALAALFGVFGSATYASWFTQPVDAAVVAAEVRSLRHDVGQLVHAVENLNKRIDSVLLAERRGRGRNRGDDN